MEMVCIAPNEMYRRLVFLGEKSNESSFPRTESDRLPNRFEILDLDVDLDLLDFFDFVLETFDTLDFREELFEWRREPLYIYLFYSRFQPWNSDKLYVNS